MIQKIKTIAIKNLLTFNSWCGKPKLGKGNHLGLILDLEMGNPEASLARMRAAGMVRGAVWMEEGLVFKGQRDATLLTGFSRLSRSFRCLIGAQDTSNAKQNEE